MGLFVRAKQDRAGAGQVRGTACGQLWDGAWKVSGTARGQVRDGAWKVKGRAWSLGRSAIRAEHLWGQAETMGPL